MHAGRVPSCQAYWNLQARGNERGWNVSSKIFLIQSQSLDVISSSFFKEKLYHFIPGQASHISLMLFSRFICIGDSGEQDLEMYVSLALAHPDQILAIYIRDVTSPISTSNILRVDALGNLSLDEHVPSTYSISERARSPLRQSMIVPPVSVQPPARARNSCDFSRTRPIAPPKPLHLSSSKTIVETRRSLVESPQPQKTSTSSYFDITGGSSTSGRSSSDLMGERGEEEWNAADKARLNVVELLRSRVRKAELELGTCTAVMTRREKDDEGKSSSYPSTAKLGRTTRLRLFRTGDQCMQEALSLVKEFS